MDLAEYDAADNGANFPPDKHAWERSRCVIRLYRYHKLLIFNRKVPIIVRRQRRQTVPEITERDRIISNSNGCLAWKFPDLSVRHDQQSFTNAINASHSWVCDHLDITGDTMLLEPIAHYHIEDNHSHQVKADVQQCNQVHPTVLLLHLGSSNVEPQTLPNPKAIHTEFHGDTLDSWLASCIYSVDTKIHAEEWASTSFA